MAKPGHTKGADRLAMDAYIANKRKATRQRVCMIPECRSVFETDQDYRMCDRCRSFGPPNADHKRENAVMNSTAHYPTGRRMLPIPSNS
jgi:hypothetical protein